MSKYLLTVLGLEGTGHHGICSVLSGAVKHDLNLEESMKRLITADVQTLGQRSSEIVKRLRTLPSASTTMFQCTNKPQSISGFKMSFPDQSLSKNLHEMEGKVTTYLNVPHLQSLCIQSNVTLIVVHLRRTISEAIVSSTRFGDFASQARILRLNLLALNAMLPHIDNKFDVRYTHFANDMRQLSPYVDIGRLNMSLFRANHHELTEAQREYADALFFDMK